VSAVVFVLAAVAAGCVPAARALARADWPRRAPVAAILLWQALGLSWGLAAVGTLIGLGVSSGTGVAGGALASVAAIARTVGSPAALATIGAYGGLRIACLAAGFVLLAVLCWILIAATAVALRARQRQRTLLNLLAHGDPKVPGALVVDYPAAAAYCLPGLRSAIVISAGTIALLDDHELAAVLAHERAHLRERHDLVLLPFIALLRAFRWAAVARQAHRTVGLLVEMHADDRALRHRPARELATALLRVGAAGGKGVPAGALGAIDPATDGEVAARVIRLLHPAPALGTAALALVLAAAACIVAVPTALLFIPIH
jgi:beta-lactamase regulating signal transducer with metallopeptidase domain